LRLVLSINRSDDARQTLALIILRHVDEGERDPQRLADAAMHELAGLATAGRLATG